MKQCVATYPSAGGRRETRGMCVPRKEYARSRHQRLFEENVGKTGKDANYELLSERFGSCIYARGRYQHPTRPSQGTAAFNRMCKHDFNFFMFPFYCFYCYFCFHILFQFLYLYLIFVFVQLYYVLFVFLYLWMYVVVFYFLFYSICFVLFFYRFLHTKNKKIQILQLLFFNVFVEFRHFLMLFIGFLTCIN